MCQRFVQAYRDIVVVFRVFVLVYQTLELVYQRFVLVFQMLALVYQTFVPEFQTLTLVYQTFVLVFQTLAPVHQTFVPRPFGQPIAESETGRNQNCCPMEKWNWLGAMSGRPGTSSNLQP